MTESERRKMEVEKRDAIRQMREFEQRGNPPPSPDFLRIKTNGNNGFGNSSPPPAEKAPKYIPPAPTKGFNLLKMLNFDNFKPDKDFAVIAAMLLLLSSEESDELLLLALLYIIM